MLANDDLERARVTYLNTRHIWLADGLLDAHERLALVTVASRLREFAFLNHLKPSARLGTASLLATIGFQSRVLSSGFDLRINFRRVSAQSTHAYNTHRARQRFLGLGVWLGANRKFPREKLTLSQLGIVLGYPECCVRMDVRTKEQDHQLFLQALVREFGDDPTQISWALRRGCQVQKSSYAYLRRWDRRYRSTLARYPFALHAACDQCLKDPDSPTARLNRSYDRLAQDVSEELHFLVRWSAHIGCGGSKH